jgi:hypothetical protein
MEQAERTRLGNTLALLAAGGLIADLSRGWYTFKVPAALLDRADQISSQLGALGPLVREGARELAASPPIGISAWRAFEGIDVTLLMIAIGVIAAAVLGMSGGVKGLGRLIALAGAIAGALVLYRIAKPPGPSELLSVADGAWIALLLAGGIVAGGVIAATGAGEASSAPAPRTPVEYVPQHLRQRESVPPPRSSLAP